MTETSTDILVVGGGFGGAYAARVAERLVATRGVRICLVAPENFLLFSPLLAEAASGTIEPRHAVIPLRELLTHTSLIAGTVQHVDHERRCVQLRDAAGGERELRYGTIVLAAGSVPVSLPIPGLAEHAVGFKTLADAIWLRNRVLYQLEVANAQPPGDRRREMLTFTFVGGGYAGVEALAELESLVRDALRRYPSLQPSDTRWVLVEAQDRLLPGLSPKLAEYTERVLMQREVEVHLNTRMLSCTDKRVVLSGGIEFVSDTIVWTVGQRPSALVAGTGLPLDDRGRIVVDDHLRAAPGAYAIGDSAAVPDPDGGTSPGTAQHALRQGVRCGRNVAADHGVGTAGPFTYRNRGLAVTLGMGQGSAQVRWPTWPGRRDLTFTGWPAWWMGRSYHLLMMPGIGRRVRVVSDWTISMLFPRDVAQLGSLGKPSPI